MARTVERPSVRGERLGGFIYGTIVALAGIVAEARAYPDQPALVALLTAVTSSVFWLAHVYAHGLGQSVARDQHLHFGELREIARHEFSIVEAAFPPVVPILLAAVGILAASTAYWLAFALGLAVLTLEGIRFARIERLGLLGTLGVVAVNLGLGLLLVFLKLFVTH
jgi:hypothetical protein